jgi:hypothetical protein
MTLSKTFICFKCFDQILYELTTYLTCATRSARLTFLDVITVICLVFGKEYKHMAPHYTR